MNAKPNGAMTATECKDKVLIVPGDPIASVISNVIKATYPSCTAGRMPDDCSTTSDDPRRCLTDKEIETIDAWIRAGAPL